VTATSTLLSVFAAGAAVSLGASWLLVTRLERIGATLGFSEALLGMVAALAADAPEITSAITALAGHEPKIGAGVVIGSNVFNLAALLGVSALIAGHIALDRSVIELEGAVALWIAAVCVVVVVGLISPAVGLMAVLVVFVPYLAVLAVRHERLRRLGLPPAWSDWLTAAVVEEEAELLPAIHPRPGGTRDAAGALIAVVTVVTASIAMEKTAARLGARHHVPDIVVGGLVLAAVTSLPNAVAAVYLARRGRGAATLSTAMNSNALNVTIGFLLPGALVGIGVASASSTLVAGAYLAVTLVALACAYIGGGLRRIDGAVIISAYLAFVVALLVVA
jgi:cation:H+ antiporter